jgi:hypothetical protein
LRFIKLETELENQGNGKTINFNNKENFFRIRDQKKFEILKTLISGIFSAKTDSEFNAGEDINYNLHISYNDTTYRLDSKGNITEENSPADGNSRQVINSHITLEQYIKIFKKEIFSAISYIEINGTSETEFSPEILSSAFINMEMLKLNIPLTDKEKHLNQKEQELSGLLKQKQLIEIKKMRKEKLQKEISSVNRVLTRLNKDSTVLEDFRDTLKNIAEKIVLKEKLNSKINDCKKDVLKLRDLKNHLNELEKGLKTEFPQFKNYTENLADLEEVEKNFNNLKEINSRIDNIQYSEKTIRKRTFRTIGGITVFSITALLFLSIQGDTGPIPYIAVSSVIISLLIALISYMKLKKYNPESLTAEKEIYRKKMTESLGNSSFSFDNFKTEELYEFLLQYFDDFIKFSEIKSEIASIKEELASLPGLKETEKKLDSQSSEVSAIEKDISLKLEGLDQSIIAIEDIEYISDYISEINELIESAEGQIKQEDSIRKKIEHEIADYDKKDNTDTSYSIQLADIDEKIKNAEDEKAAILYLHDIMEVSSLKWNNERLEALSDLSWEMMKDILPEYSLKPENIYREAIRHFITHGEKTSPLNEIPYSLIKTSVIYAFENLTGSSLLLPPLLLVLKPDPDENITCEKIIKNVLELFPERQVIIITSATIPGISGKITDI